MFTLICFIHRRKYAAAAFSISASYDSAISSYFCGTLGESSPVATRVYQPQVVLKYGCNPHQKPAGIYNLLGHNMPFQILNGTPGYINLLDACNAWQLVISFYLLLLLYCYFYYFYYFYYYYYSFRCCYYCYCY